MTKKELIEENKKLKDELEYKELVKKADESEIEELKEIIVELVRQLY